MLRFKFEGTDTQRRVKYNAEADTVIELYCNLVNQGIISTVDGDPYDETLMKKYNVSWDDFKDKDGYDDFDKFTKWRESEADDLTDEEILEVITNEQGNAYYQKIYEWNSDLQEYEEI
ncbi:MAG: hypothetical protein ACRDD7_11215 [Peptostreptococcaceae bacterium]